MSSKALDLRGVVKKHAGSYVALKEGTNKVVAAGTDPIKVNKAASKKGYKDAVLFKVPEPNKCYIL
ncbi:MAG: hypothetical protein KAI03_03480 [Candidatus Aureabacteria bacterium]|nr:hypothetical protein [Candidatus Auribacterota bacterium]